MAELVGHDVRLRELPLGAELVLELLQEVEVEVQPWSGGQ